MDKFVTRIKRKSPKKVGIDNLEEFPRKILKTDSKNASQETSICEQIKTESESLADHSPDKFRKIRGENLNCDYTVLYKRKEADDIMKECEGSLVYNTGDLARVHVFGKWHNIPRKQVAHGDPGLTYTFSGVCVPARPWTPLLLKIRERITDLTGYSFNFVLINRYKDGSDHMGEHRDDERELVDGSPIASLSLGQPRDFVFKHADSRGKDAKRVISPVKVVLEHGSLLMMNYPTNKYWYHSLPSRKKITNVRINMTFRQMVMLKK